MKTYREFAPTGYDTRGLGLSDRQSWYVLPIAHNRDSDKYEESNWNAAIDALSAEDNTFEVHRFGHWACGWFEVALIEPGSKEEVIAHTLIARLENYPLLNEDDPTLCDDEDYNEND